MINDKEFIEKENNKVKEAIKKASLSHNQSVNKDGFCPTFLTPKEDYYAENEKYKGQGSDREKLSQVWVKDKTTYENYDDDNFALIIELANFLPIDDIVKLTNVDKEVVIRVIKRANKIPVQEFDKPPIVIWLPRFMWRFVDLVNLRYNPKWVEEAKEAFFKTLKKIRSKLYRV